MTNIAVGSNTKFIRANNDRVLVVDGLKTYCPAGSKTWVDFHFNQDVPEGARSGYPGWGYMITFQPEGKIEYVADARGTTEQGRMWSVPDLARGSALVPTNFRDANLEFTWRLYWYGYHNSVYYSLLTRAFMKVETYPEEV